MADEKVVVFVGCYDTLEDAEEDFRIVEYEHAEEFLATFDIAVLEKSADGRLSVRHKHETARGLAGWAGFAAGIVAGLVFPPVLPTLGFVGAAAGIAVGHFWKGMSRRDIHELGEMLESSNAALIVVVNAEDAEPIASQMGRAVQLKRVETDANKRDIDAAIRGIAEKSETPAAT